MLEIDPGPSFTKFRIVRPKTKQTDKESKHMAKESTLTSRLWNATHDGGVQNSSSQRTVPNECIFVWECAKVTVAMATRGSKTHVLHSGSNFVFSTGPPN